MDRAGANDEDRSSVSPPATAGTGCLVPIMEALDSGVLSSSEEGVAESLFASVSARSCPSPGV